MLTLALALTLSVAAPDGPALDRYRALSEEYRDRERAYAQACRGANHDPSKQAEARKLAPDDDAFAARFFALADEEPAGPAAPDALYETLLLQPGRLGPIGREAIHRLRRDFATDPKMANYVVQLAHRPWPEVEPLLRDVLARNPDRNAQGLACQALAIKLDSWSQYPNLLKDPETARKLAETTGPDQIAAILKHDPDALLAEATALHERVVGEFDDVRRFADHPTNRGVIGPYSREWLDGRRKLAIGREAPEIEGHDLDGKPLRLADYRGKVVVLVFSASWCAACVEQIPNEKALVARMRGRPFALLGVNCDRDVASARELTAREGISWPQWFDGDPAAREGADGPIRARYAIQSFPAVFVLDHRGVIRERGVRGKALDDAVDRLIDFNRPTARDDRPPGPR